MDKEQLNEFLRNYEIDREDTWYFLNTLSNEVRLLRKEFESFKKSFLELENEELK